MSVLEVCVEIGVVILYSVFLSSRNIQKSRKLNIDKQQAMECCIVLILLVIVVPSQSQLADPNPANTPAEGPGEDGYHRSKHKTIVLDGGEKKSECVRLMTTCGATLDSLQDALQNENVSPEAKFSNFCLKLNGSLQCMARNLRCCSKEDKLLHGKPVEDVVRTLDELCDPNSKLYATAADNLQCMLDLKEDPCMETVTMAWEAYNEENQGSNSVEKEATSNEDENRCFASVVPVICAFNRLKTKCATAAEIPLMALLATMQRGGLLFVEMENSSCSPDSLPRYLDVVSKHATGDTHLSRTTQSSTLNRNRRQMPWGWNPEIGFGFTDYPPWNAGPYPWNGGPNPWNGGPNPWNGGPNPWYAGPNPWNGGPNPWYAGPDPWNSVHYPWNTDQVPLNWIPYPSSTFPANG